MMTKQLSKPTFVTCKGGHFGGGTLSGKRPNDETNNEADQEALNYLIKQSKKENEMENNENVEPMLPTGMQANEDQNEMTDAEIEKWENSNVLIPPEVRLAIHKAKEKHKSVYLSGRPDSKLGGGIEPLMPNTY